MGWSLASGTAFKVAVAVGITLMVGATAAGVVTSYSTSDAREQRNTLYTSAGQDPKLKLLDGDFDDVPDVKENRVLSTDRLVTDSDADGVPDAWEAFFGLNPNEDQDAQQDQDRDGLTSVGEYEASLESLQKRGFSTGFDPAKGLDPLDPDTDGDKLPDGWEVDYGLDPLLTSGNEEDLDGDALTNIQEFDAGSDPTNFDTDGDGLSDGREVRLLKTDPSSRDSDGDTMEDPWEVDHGLNANNPNDRFEDPDGDGLLNLVEYVHKTEPKIADSDGDSIPDGWEVDFGLDPTSFADGVADPDADALNNAGEYLMRKGLYQQSTDPLNPDTDGDGLLDGLEKAEDTNPFRPDTDRDDLTDGEELLVYGTNPLTPDSDGDDLTDGDEIKVTFTNATLFDSDSDNLADGEEYRYWTKRANEGRELLETTGRLSTYISLQYPGADQDTLLKQLSAQGDPDRDGLVNIRDEDSDADELNDGIEVALVDPADCLTGKLDPAEPDTDGDKMPDGWELRGLLDPCDPRDADDDPDADGLVLFRKGAENATIAASPPNRQRPPGYDVTMNGGLPKFTNLMEYQNDTSPVNTDSDCDGLPDGWEVYYTRNVRIVFEGESEAVEMFRPDPADGSFSDNDLDFDRDGYDYTGPNGLRDGLILDDEEFVTLEEWYFFTDPHLNNTDRATYKDPLTGNMTFVGDGTEVYFSQDPGENSGATVGLSNNGRSILETSNAAKKGKYCNPRYDQIPWGLQDTGIAPVALPPASGGGRGGSGLTPAPGLSLAVLAGLVAAATVTPLVQRRARRAKPVSFSET